jgi:uncharacterized protein YegL
MKSQLLSAAALVALVVPAACKSGTQAGGPIGSTSGLASISIGDVTSVEHKEQELTVTTNGSTNTYRGKEKFAGLKFTAGQTVTLGMKLYTADNKVAAQTVDGADSKCKPKTMTLAGGNNPARIPLCLPSEPGRPVSDPATATTATTSGQNADLDVKPCIVGKDPGCEDGTSSTATATAAAVTPEFNGQQVTFDYVLFAIDISGSMAGKKWDSAKAELKKVAEAMAAKKGTETVINIIAFNGKVSKFLDGEINSVSAELDNLKKWLDGLKPSGQTAMKAGLGEAFSYYSGLFKTVYLITDGAPTDMGIKDEDLASLVKENTGKLPVHVHAISPAADYQAFLKKLADQTGGTFNLYNP